MLPLSYEQYYSKETKLKQVVFKRNILNKKNDLFCKLFIFKFHSKNEMFGIDFKKFLFVTGINFWNSIE